MSESLPEWVLSVCRFTIPELALRAVVELEEQKQVVESRSDSETLFIVLKREKVDFVASPFCFCDSGHINVTKLSLRFPLSMTLWKPNRRQHLLMGPA